MLFFKRFIGENISKVVENSKIKKFKENDVLFPPEKNVYVITAGNVAVIDHQKEEIDKPQIIAYYHEGDIIGLSEKDN